MNKKREIVFVFVITFATFLIVLMNVDDNFLVSKDKTLYYVKNLLNSLFGWNFYLIPLFMVLMAIYVLRRDDKNFWWYFFYSFLLVFGLFILFPDPLSKAFYFSNFFKVYLGELVSFFLSLLFILISLVYIFNINVSDLIEEKIPLFVYKLFKLTFSFVVSSFKLFVNFLDKLGSFLIFISKKLFYKYKGSEISGDNFKTNYKAKENFKDQDKKVDNVKENKKVKNSESNEIKKINKIGDIENLDLEKIKENSFMSVDNYFIPSPFFLHSFVSKIYPRPKSNSTKDYSDILEDSLRNFGIQAKVVDTQIGPSITRYELQIEKGIKVSQILRLKNDIALALAAIAVRIEAPIPGKSAIGIEVPNDKPIPVYLSDIITSDDFIKSNSEIPLALGKDVSGNIIICDLTKTPHLLIAGSTGSGKTVCVNSIICSMLFKFPPTKLQLLLIDPKMVELILYEGVPHVIDIVTDVKKAPVALEQMVKIMEDRYKLFSNHKVRNIQEYNSLFDVEKLPYIVIVIDELADLMMTSPAVEGYIARLTQLARAAGIHLIIATQRPSTNVITGIIKANVPSRIAFAVASQIDSRVILDISGAENLIGRGDMLYMPIGVNRPIRAQGCFVGLKEIELIVKYWQLQPKPENMTLINLDSVSNLQGFEDSDEDPELLKQAAKIILEDKRASTTLLQRKMRIGFAKAGRIMDILEKLNIVGPQEGSKPRKILVQSIEDIEKIFKGS